MMKSEPATRIRTSATNVVSAAVMPNRVRVAVNLFLRHHHGDAFFATPDAGGMKRHTRIIRRFADKRVEKSFGIARAAFQKRIGAAIAGQKIITRLIVM